MNEKFAHTPGRLRVVNDCGEWSARHDGFGASCYQGVSSDDGFMIALAVAHDAEPFGDPDTRANARRLAACWNACEDVPIEALEAGMAGGLPWSVADQIEKMVDRDFLLEALSLLLHEVDESAIAGAADCGWKVAVQKSRAALAKATGKTSEAA